jgi:hypothetical protein
MRRLPLQTRLSLSFIGLSFLTTFVPAYLYFDFAVRQTLDDTGRKLSSIAAVGALQVDGDLHARVRGPGPEFDRVVEQMRRLLGANTDQSIVHVYSLRPEAPDPNGVVNETEFAVDAARAKDFPWLAPEDIAPYGKKYCLDAGMKSSLYQGVRGSTANLYRNGCGVWRTGYAPIRTSDGKIDAVLCVDGSVLDEDLRIHALRSLCQSFVVGSMLVAFVLSLVAGRWMRLADLTTPEPEPERRSP